MPLADVFSALLVYGYQILQLTLPFPLGSVLHIPRGSPPGESVVLWGSLLRQHHKFMSVCSTATKTMEWTKTFGQLRGL